MSNKKIFPRELAFEFLPEKNCFKWEMKYILGDNKALKSVVIFEPIDLETRCLDLDLEGKLEATRMLNKLEEKVMNEL
jgi:hypothetical protein